MIQDIDFRAIASEGLKRSEDVLEVWLPGGKQVGQEYVVKNPKRADSSPGSFKINTTRGTWSDFATGDKGGDLVALIAYIEGTPQLKAAKRLADFLGVSGVKGVNGVNSCQKSHEQPVSRIDDPLTPADQLGVNGVNEPQFVATLPANAPALPETHYKHGKPTQMWFYRNTDRSIFCAVCRFDTDSGKQYSPLTLWSRGTEYKWMWKGPPEKRLPFNLDKIASTEVPILVTEGEKAADGAALLFPDFVVTTSMSGAQSSHKTDWSSLRGRDVWIFPDNDDAGHKYAARVHKLVNSAGAKSATMINLKLLEQFCLERFGYELKPGDDAVDLVMAGMTSEQMADFFAQTDAAGKSSVKQTTATRYFVSDQGVYYVGDVDDQPLLICSPLRIEAAVCDENSENWGRLLSFEDRAGKTHYWSMPMELLRGSGEEFRGNLLSLGLT
jgi:putative DNA primase/helicase